MAHFDIVMAGVGGQGVLLAGQILTWAGLINGCQVSYVPSYGAEMRGGMSSCSIVISDLAIGCPLVSEPNVLLAFHQHGLQTWEEKVVPGGLLIYNSSLIPEPPQRTDIQTNPVPFNDLAVQIKNPQGANLVALGALVALTGLVPENALLEAFKKVIPKAKHHLIKVNQKAFTAGYRTVS